MFLLSRTLSSVLMPSISGIMMSSSSRCTVPLMTAVERLQPVIRFLDRIAFSLQENRDAVYNLLIVIYHQYFQLLHSDPLLYGIIITKVSFDFLYKILKIFFRLKNAARSAGRAAASL